MKKRTKNASIDPLIDFCKLSLLKKKDLVEVAIQEELFQLAVHHRVTRPLEQACNRPEVTISSGSRTQLKAIGKKQTLRMLSLTAELVLINEMLEKHQVLVIPLKGPVAAFQIYGDYTAKTSRDLDILVKEEQLDQAIELLESLGYEMKTSFSKYSNKQKHYFKKINNQLVFINHRKHIQVELHWRLFANPHFLPISFDELLHTSTKVNIGQAQLVGLSKDNLLLYLCAHGAKHKWALLYWLHEVTALVQKEEFDWEEVLNKSIQIGVEKPLVQGVVLTHEIFGVRINTTIQKYYQKQPKIQNLVHSVEEVLLGNQSHNTSKSITNYWKLLDYKLKLGKGLPYKLNFFHGISVNDFELIKLSNDLFFMYFWLRPIFWLWRYVLSPNKKK